MSRAQILPPSGSLLLARVKLKPPALLVLLEVEVEAAVAVL